MKKKYILFDNDGVLVDTENWYFEASKKKLAELGYDLSFEKYMKIMIAGENVWGEPRADGYSEEEIAKFIAKRDEYYKEYIRTKDIYIDGVEEVLKDLRKDFKMAIVTTSKREPFELIHKDENLLKYMDFVLVREDYKISKPNPEPYLKAIEKFGCSKEEAIIIEDSQRGLQAAVNAGIDCICVANEFTKSHDFSQAQYRIDSLDELKKFL